MTGEQEFLVADVVRLEVQQGWPDLPNDVLNPSGEGGAWGWTVTDESADPTPGISDYVHLWGLTDHFEFAVTDDLETGTQAAAIYAIEIARVEAAGQSFRASVDVQSLAGMPPDGTFGVRLSGDDTNDFAFPDPLSVGVNELPTTDIPVGTNKIEFFYLTPEDAEAGHLIRFRDVCVVHGATADVDASDPLSEPPWTDILGSAASIEVDRSNPLQVGILSATLYDSSLDPATTNLVWPGKRCRLHALVDGTWESLFDGKLNAPSSAYEVRDPDRPDEKRVEVTLSGSDAAGPLTSTPRAEGVGTLDELPYVLLGTHVPFNINGSSIALDPAIVVVEGFSDQASALDQIAMTRDSVLGYVWFDRAGVLQAWDRVDMPDDVTLTLDEAHYSDIDVDWDVDLTFNTVEIEQLRPDGTSWTWGPFVDELAKRQWNERKATFRVLGVADDDVEFYARTVLGLNSTPVKRINSVTLPVRTIAELEARALLDLYDLVSVSNDRAEIADQESRVVGVKHRLTIKREGRSILNRWFVDLQLTGQQTGGGAETARAAVPQATPPQVPSFARIRSMLSGAGRVKPTDFGAVGDGVADDSTALVDCWEALGEAADVAQFRGQLEVDRPYLFNVAVKQFGGYTVLQSTPRRLSAVALDYLEPGLIASGDEAQYLFGQTGDGSGSLNDNPGSIHGLCIDGAGVAGAEGLFYADAAQSSVYDLMVMGCVADGIAVRNGRSQNLNYFNPQIGQNDGIGFQLMASPGQQGPGHIQVYGGHIHDNKTGIQLNGTAGDFFPPHDNSFFGTLIESGRIAGQEIRVAIEALAGLATQFTDCNVTYGGQVGGMTGNDVELDCCVLIDNPAFPGYSTVFGFRGGTIGGGVNKVSDGIRIKQDPSGAANKLVLRDDPGFANVDYMTCVDGDHATGPDFADPIVDVDSLHAITGVTGISRVLNGGTRLNHGHETPVGTRYELPDGISNGEIQNPTVIKHGSETYSRYSQDWNGQMRWLDPTTGALIGTIARNGNVWGTGGQFVIGASLGFTPTSTTLAASGAVAIDSNLTARHEIGFSSGGVNATSVAISNGITGRRIVLSILGSGGANTITWPASSVIQFRTTAPQPIAGVRQYVELEYVGTKWFEVSRSG